MFQESDAGVGFPGGNHFLQRKSESPRHKDVGSCGGIRAILAGGVYCCRERIAGWARAAFHGETRRVAKAIKSVAWEKFEIGGAVAIRLHFIAVERRLTPVRY